MYSRSFLYIPFLLLFAVIMVITVLESSNRMFETHRDFVQELKEKSEERYETEGQVESKKIIKGGSSSTTTIYPIGNVFLPLSSSVSYSDKYIISINGKNLYVERNEWEAIKEGDKLKIFYDGLDNVQEYRKFSSP